MELVGGNYPMRVFVRYKATEQLKLELDTYSSGEPLDRELFEEIATSLFGIEKNQKKFERRYSSREEASEIEDCVVAELVETYKQIKAKQENPLIQKLNSLL
jgi:hypothetical protein